MDGENWKTIVDRKDSHKDSPNAYLALSQPIEAKFVRYSNVEVPSPNLALSEIRVFGLGLSEKPKEVRGFEVDRQEDRRDAELSWSEVEGAQGYNIRWGIAPDKLYHSWLIYKDSKLLMRNLDRDTEYYFSIEAFNENGISGRSEVLRVK
ncbi:fibronectin type III domain-containing protein [Algoriphagus hitonicola]